MLNGPDSIFISSCPNCGGNIHISRLIRGSVCKRCIENDYIFMDPGELVSVLAKNGKIEHLEWLKENLNEYSLFEDLFSRAIGKKPLHIQRSWALRALRGESFAIVAPPGMGKSTFGLLMSFYFTFRNFKTLAIFPTKMLVEQGYKKISEYSEKTGIYPKTLMYHSGVKKKIDLMEEIERGDFQILLITGKFAVKNAEVLSRIPFSFFFIDDVDMALKSSKSMLATLKIIGFRDDDFTLVKNIMARYEQQEIFDTIHRIRSERLSGKVAVFSSATARKTLPTFASLMGFHPGSPLFFLRNVYDSYSTNFSMDFLVEAVTLLGSGTLIFVPPDISCTDEMENRLSARGIRAKFVKSGKEAYLEQFERGEIDVLIGSAVHYGILVRGIDMPSRIRSAVFFGIPRFTFKIDDVLPVTLLPRLISALSVIYGDESLSSLASRLRKRIEKMSSAALSKLQDEIKNGSMDDDLIQAYSNALNALKDFSIKQKLSAMVGFTIDGERVMVPDALTYIQASGRTSRIYGGPITTGISLLIVDSLSLFENFRKRLDSIAGDVKWTEFRVDSRKIGDMQIDEILKIMDEERRRIKGREVHGLRTRLMIVESPTKAKTISGFFSRPSSRDLGGVRVYETVTGDSILTVVATQGHLMELTTRPVGFHGVGIGWENGKMHFIPYYGTIKRCINGHQFVDTRYGLCPKCGAPVEMDKIVLIKSLQKLALDSDEVVICTDPDTEGEKIAWDVYAVLRPFNRNIRRCEFHEVTKSALKNALDSSREIEENLVKAQMVRRIEDRWVGFTLSRRLQTEFWGMYCRKKGLNCSERMPLSAGRVQTPVLGWVINNYRAYLKGRRKYCLFTADGVENLKVALEVECAEIRAGLKNAYVEERELHPAPPFTTDTLLIDASFLGIKPEETMALAQDLFENGLITYHRTDSTRVSLAGIGVAEKYLKEKLGENYREIFLPRNWGEGGAHEAIRPTRPMDKEELYLALQEGEINAKLTGRHISLYDLIFRRFITSQLKKIQTVYEVVNLDINGKIVTIERLVNVRLNDMDLSTYPFLYSQERIEGSIIDVLKKLQGDILLKPVKVTYRSDVEPFTQGKIVAEMKIKGIGRPSTYATIIKTLFQRGYVVERGSWVIPTELGIWVHAFLVRKFGNFVGEERTRVLMEKMDKVEGGEMDYREVLESLLREMVRMRKM